NSSIRVATSMRSGTLNFLHVSEFGKIAARFPDRAREVVTGSINTIATGGLIFIESTAEGQDGRFYDMCMAAQARTRMQTEIGPLDFKFHFFPWWQNSEYAIELTSVPITAELEAYFNKLETLHAIVLSE